MRAPSIYFFIPENDDVYFDAPLVLAEGLRDLGIDFHSNRDWWRLDAERPDTLFKHSPHVDFRDCEVVVIHDDWFYHYPQSTLAITERPAPPGLWQLPASHKIVYIDTWVGARTNSWKPEFRRCDLILRTQYNGRCEYPANVRPWALGFTHRIANAAIPKTDFALRRNSIVHNAGYTHPFAHGVRQLFDRQVAPRVAPVVLDTSRSSPEPRSMPAYDRLMWEQTVDKHNPDYFERLGESKFCAAFCGYLCPALPADASVHFRGEKRFQLLAAACRLLSSVTPLAPRLIQWDSWRFWEALCAGCIPLHLDLEKYGVALPVMPANGEHYIGFDLDRLDTSLERLRDSPEALAAISRAGREWAQRHYSPEMMARRFLAELGYAVPATR